MPSTRAIVSIGLGLVALIALTAFGFAMADRHGFSTTLCSVTAFEAPDARGAVEIPAEVYEKHPEWGQVLIRAAPSQGATEAFDCARYEEMRADLDALGAPTGPEHGSLVSHGGKAYDLTARRGVA